MSKILIKDDVHSSTDNLDRFENIQEEFDHSLAEVARASHRFSLREFHGIFGVISYLAFTLFFRVFGGIQRDYSDYSTSFKEVKPLDIEINHMHEYLTIIDKLKLFLIFGGYWTFLGYAILDSGLGMTGSALIIGISLILFLLAFPIIFISILAPIREEYMAGRIESFAEDEDNVIAYMGAAHSWFVKRRLEARGHTVDREKASRLIRWTANPLLGFLSIILRPLSFLKNRY